MRRVSGDKVMMMLESCDKRDKSKLGDDDRPTYVFNDPQVGYWVLPGESRGEEPTATP